jgi:hypothetical protein
LLLPFPVDELWMVLSWSQQKTMIQNEIGFSLCIWLNHKQSYTLPVDIHFPSKSVYKWAVSMPEKPNELSTGYKALKVKDSSKADPRKQGKSTLPRIGFIL